MRLLKLLYSATGFITANLFLVYMNSMFQIAMSFAFENIMIVFKKNVSSHLKERPTSIA